MSSVAAGWSSARSAAAPDAGSAGSSTRPGPSASSAARWTPSGPEPARPPARARSPSSRVPDERITLTTLAGERGELAVAIPGAKVRGASCSSWPTAAIR